MARLARVVIPDRPHPVTQKGNRREPVFFSGDDDGAYPALIATAAHASRTAIRAYCLLPNPRCLSTLRQTLSGSSVEFLDDLWLARQQRALVVARGAAEQGAQGVDLGFGEALPAGRDDLGDGAEQGGSAAQLV